MYKILNLNFVIIIVHSDNRNYIKLFLIHSECNVKVWVIVYTGFLIQIILLLQCIQRKKKNSA